MNRDDAFRVLGVTEGATADEIRGAFRSLVRTHHPDRSGQPDSGGQTATIIEAYRVLRDGSPPPQPPPPAPRPGRFGPVVAELVDDGTIAVAAGGAETFMRLLDAAYRLGEVTYIDRESALMETMVTFDDGTVASLLITLQGRANGTTEAFCTLESIDGRAGPPVSSATSALLEEVRNP